MIFFRFLSMVMLLFVKVVMNAVLVQLNDYERSKVYN